MNHTDNISRGGEKNKMPTALQTETYKNIMGVYDDIERIIKLGEMAGNEYEPYVKHLQKFVETVDKQTEILLNNFFRYMESGRVLSGVEKLKIEKAAKDITIATNQFLAKVKN